MPYYIGIDPGLDGGIAVIGPDCQPSLRVMPTIEIQVAKKTRRSYDHNTLRDLALGWQLIGVDLLVLEDSPVMPKEGGTSARSTGYGAGCLRQLCADHYIKAEVVNSKTWQKVFGISSAKGDTKKQAAAICLSLYPGLELRRTVRCRDAHDGMCDALLMAEYARRRSTGGV